MMYSDVDVGQLDCSNCQRGVETSGSLRSQTCHWRHNPWYCAIQHFHCTGQGNEDAHVCFCLTGIFMVTMS